MGMHLDAPRAAAPDNDIVHMQPDAVRPIELDAGIDLTAGTAGTGSAHPPAALDDALHQPDQMPGIFFGGDDEELAGAALPGLALSTTPMVDYTHGQASGASVIDVLRGVITVTGAHPAPQPAYSRASSRGGDSWLALLQPLAMDLLESGVTDRRVLDGATVFSILGRGAFVVEAARDGSGVVLSELNSGLGFVLGRDPATQHPQPQARSWDLDRPAPVAAHWQAASGNEHTLRWMVDAIVDLLHGLVKAVVWAATNPVVLALAVPVLIVVMLLGAVCRRTTPDTVPHSAPSAHANTAAPATGAAPARRRRRRRQSRRRSTWSMLVGQVRESIGFPDADSLREHDFTKPRDRASRTAPKSA